MLATLASRGVLTPAPIAARSGALFGDLVAKPATILPWCDGDMRCQASVTPTDAHRLGGALARVHLAGEGVPVGGGRFQPDDVRRRLDLVERDARFAPFAPMLRRKLDTWVARRAEGLTQGLVHGDLFRDNVLWKADGSLSALLDFESASRGPLAYDIMVCVLSWGFGDGLEAPIVRALIEGYSATRPLTAAERGGLVAEGCVAAIRFASTRLTDYAMRAGTVGPRVVKDFRRFIMRLEALEALDAAGEASRIGLA